MLDQQRHRTDDVVAGKLIPETTNELDTRRLHDGTARVVAVLEFGHDLIREKFVYVHGVVDFRYSLLTFLPNCDTHRQLNLFGRK